MLNKIFMAIFLLIWLFACKKESEWIFKKEIILKEVQPIGLAIDNENLWVSDVENNRMLMLDLDGKVIKEIPKIIRPMHFCIQDSKIYVPEFLTDTIRIIENGKISFLPLQETIDAPSSISVNGNIFAVADFYHHRIILNNNGKTIIIGNKGNNKGELYYPTDVEISDDRIFVADAYNNRVQVFNMQGESIRIIGEKDNINTATGLTVTSEYIFVTDFEKSEVIIFDKNGKVLQKLTEHLNQPTDIFFWQNTIYVANYNGKSISIFEKK